MNQEQQLRALLLEIQNDLQGNEAMETADEKLNITAGSQLGWQDEEYSNRNRLYTLLLETYIANYKQKEKTKGVYKCIFFIVTIILFIGIVVSGIIGIILLSMYGDGSLANVGIAIANIAGIISTLIVLPRIIAEHLFPTNEESNMLEMVKNMQNNDSEIRNVLFETDEEKK